MNSNVLIFPSRDKDGRDQMTAIQERLVEGGLFKTISEVPTVLVLFILQYWKEIYNAGYVEGACRDDEKVLH